VTTISQRELRNDNAEIMRRVENGESFTVTRYGHPVARLEPVEDGEGRELRTMGELIDSARHLPHIDYDQFRRDVDELTNPYIDFDFE
jgi:prevent-host-death family protein